MARNRRKIDGEVTLSWIVTGLLLFVLLVGFLLGITFLKRRNLKMGDELRVLHRELSLAYAKTTTLEAQLARYKTPRELESKVSQWNLGMVRPVESQIRRLRDITVISDGIIRPRVLVQADSVHP